MMAYLIQKSNGKLTGKQKIISTFEKVNSELNLGVRKVKGKFGEFYADLENVLKKLSTAGFLFKRFESTPKKSKKFVTYTLTDLGKFLTDAIETKYKDLTSKIKTIVESEK
jgi:hypothetical protein